MGGCGRCGGPAAYRREYSGESLCAGCFSRSVEAKAARAVSKYSMIAPGDRVCVAVSGGKDSLSLLHILSRMSGPGRFSLEAAAVDEGIPGYRDEALALAGRYCRRLGVRLRVVSYEGLFGSTLDAALAARGPGAPSSCSVCGVLRRRAIDAAAGEAGADVVATGHNLDDAVQTFLINLVSGDTKRIGWQDPGAAAGPPRRVKPLCEVYEREVAFYAFANGVPFQAEPCPHAGEGIRTEMREFLDGLEGRHPGAKNGLYRSSLRAAAAVRAAAPGPAARRCPRCGGRCTGAVCAACLTAGALRAPDPKADIAAPPRPGR